MAWSLRVAGARVLQQTNSVMTVTLKESEKTVFPTLYSETSNLDKLFHFVEYMFLGIVLARDLLWQRIYRKSERKKIVTFVFVIVILIFADEFHQYFRPGRMMDIFDGIADFMGASFGAFVFARFIRGKSYSTATSDDLMALRDKDRRRFAILLVPTIFFMVLTVNVLQIKTPIEGRYPLLASFFDFVEWAFLGYICHRAFYFNATVLWIKTLSYFGLIVLGAGLIFSYRYLVTGFEVGKIDNSFLVEIGIYYVFGILISFFRRFKIPLRECGIPN
jgi:VanZ family protein